MPYYDLRCPTCAKAFNIAASIADKSEKRIPCPVCGSLDLVTEYRTAPAYLKSAKVPECPNRHVCGAGCRHAG